MKKIFVLVLSLLAASNADVLSYCALNVDNNNLELHQFGLHVKGGGGIVRRGRGFSLEVGYGRYLREKKADEGQLSYLDNLNISVLVHHFRLGQLFVKHGLSIREGIGLTSSGGYVILTEDTVTNFGQGTLPRLYKKDERVAYGRANAIGLRLGMSKALGPNFYLDFDVIYNMISAGSEAFSPSSTTVGIFLGLKYIVFPQKWDAHL